MDVTGPETYSSTDPNPSFTLTALGDYTLTLTLTDGAGQTVTANSTVTVVARMPLASFSVSPTSGTTADTYTITGLDLGGGPITSWSWTVVGLTTSYNQALSGQGPFNLNFTETDTYQITLDYVGPGGAGQSMKQIGVFPPTDPVFADFSYAMAGNSGATGVIVCFTNLSSGPIVHNVWTFGDGTSLEDNGDPVCHTYANSGNFTARLHVEASDSAVFSNRTQTVVAQAAPVAHIGVSSSSITWGDTVNFSSTGSTGTITDWAWDFNNDGIIDSTAANPSNVPFTTLGSNVIRLTVSGPGGASSAEAIIMVAQAAITCDITGSLAVSAGSNTAYQSVIGNQRSRAMTYTWTITGPGLNTSYTTQNISQTWPDAVGAFLLTLNAQTDNGASCSSTKTVQVSLPTLTCGLTGDFAPYPNGTDTTYNATVGGDLGHSLSYAWTFAGSPVGTDSSAYTGNWSAPTSGTLAVTLTAGDGRTCTASHAVAVAWPALNCSINGITNPYPYFDDTSAAQQDYTYSASVTGDAGRTLTYAWYVDGAATPSSTASSIVQSWPNQSDIGAHSLRLVVTPSAGTGCDVSTTLNVNVPSPTCPTLPNVTATTPATGVTYTYSTPVIGSLFGRAPVTFLWTLEEKQSGSYVPIASGTGDTGNSSTFAFILPTNNTDYRITYRVTVTNDLLTSPATSSCTRSKTPDTPAAWASPVSTGTARPPHSSAERPTSGP